MTDLYAAIPEALRVKGLLDLPPALPGEQDLRRHLEEIVARNQPCTGTWLNFCGAGCAQHYVPAIVDEIVHRGELLTAYGGGTYSDHGKNQALFEFQSLMGELVGMEVVSTPTYDAGAATGSASLMACRITGRRGVLVPETMSADRRSQLRGFTKPVATVESVARDPATGCTDLADLRAKISGETAAVVIESPGYLGLIETEAATIADIAHEAGAMLIVGVDPISLGVLATPADYGADLVVGDLQPLGIHMYAGGGNGGFIASRDEARFVAEYPSILFSIAPAGRGRGLRLRLVDHGAHLLRHPPRCHRLHRHDPMDLGHRGCGLSLAHGPGGHGRARPRHHAARPLRGGADRGAPRRLGAASGAALL